MTIFARIFDCLVNLKFMGNLDLLDSQKFLQIDNDDIEKSRKIKYARNRFLYCSNYITKKPIS